jgi:hypothetical protein
LGILGSSPTTACVISEEKEEKAAGHSHGGGMGDMGGMM